MTPESLYSSGTSLRGLVKRFGRSTGYWRQHLIREGVIMRPPGRASSVSADVLRLWKSGERQCDIARKLEITRQRVWSIINAAK